MTDDREAWERASAIAQRSSPFAPVSKRSDGLPFLFTSATSRGILVHREQVVTARGPVAAGAYLRDIGIVTGGPSIDDVLYVLVVLDALPPVEGAHPEAYIHVPGNARLAELTARIERDRDEACVVLHYFIADAAAPASTGERLAELVPPRLLARWTLTIRAVGDVAWSHTDVAWRDPAE